MSRRTAQVRTAIGTLISRLAQSPVSELCPNPIYPAQLEMPFERKQLPQIVENRHNRMDTMEHLEPLPVLRNQIKSLIHNSRRLKSTVTKRMGSRCRAQNPANEPTERRPEIVCLSSCLACAFNDFECRSRPVCR
jgi:hypothetical protein